ncbi:MAG: class I mannose-6-phosphate isomerase [Bacteroidales bacterium]|nr:class I mannose-6-phosphate isomerase [Bacteroidales bacterium]
MEKQLYPLKFIPIPSKRVWGGSDLISKMCKSFVETDEEGNEHSLTTDDKIGESWEVADMGAQDSVVANGWLAGNTIGELMETYLERIVGEYVYGRYGRQFPLLIKFLDVQNKLSVQVHPDDEVAAQRYDSLGKNEIWYILDASPDAKIYAGFAKDITAQELYDRCHNGTIDGDLNVLHPKKGDWLHITPGTIHAADGGILVAEIQESSDVTLRLYDWGREFDPKTARAMHLEEGLDLINYAKFDSSTYHKGPLWGAEQDPVEDGPVQTMVKCPQFTVNRVDVHSPLKVSTENSGSFIIYICIEGEAVIQVPSLSGTDEEKTPLHKGDTVLVPADVAEFTILPTAEGTVLLEALLEPVEEIDDYINPDTEPFLEGEDYEGLDAEEEN